MARHPVYAGHEIEGCPAMQEYDTIYGRITAPDWPDDIILQSLSALGEWSYVEQQILAGLVQAGDRMWDGGAFLGTFGIGLAQIAAQAGRPLSRLIAIDPGAELRPCLVENLRRNVTCDQLVLSCALGAEFGRLVPDAPAEAVSANHGALAYRATATAGGDVDPEGVECVPLWHLRARHGDYDILKLDVEGMEVEAIKGDFDHIQARKPVIWAEWHYRAGEFGRRYRPGAPMKPGNSSSGQSKVWSRFS